MLTQTDHHLDKKQILVTMHPISYYPRRDALDLTWSRLSPQDSVAHHCFFATAPLYSAAITGGRLCDSKSRAQPNV